MARKRRKRPIKTIKKISVVVTTIDGTKLYADIQTQMKKISKNMKRRI